MAHKPAISPVPLAPLVDRVIRATERLSLRWKIYISLGAILTPVFALTIFLQTQVSRPLLEEEVRQIGLSVCRSLATDIAAFRLLSRPDKLEARLIEMTWQQPSIVRLDVFVPDPDPANAFGIKLIATNVADDTPPEPPGIDVSDLKDTPVSELVREPNRGYWEITFPIKDQKKVLGFLKAEVSLQLVRQVVGIFTKIAFTGNLLAIALMIGLLSYYLRHLIANERRLQRAELANIELTEQLQETQRHLFLNEKLAIMGQMTASFAHEIGTPLNSLSGHVQLLGEELDAPGPRGRLEVISSQVSRIEGIVKDFLATTRVPQKQRELVNPVAVMERIRGLVAPRLATLKAQFHIEAPANLMPVRVVPTDLEQVLLNLTNNALDALEKTDGLREVRFRAESTPKALLIQLADSGEGMSADTARQVLKPFFTTKAPGQGTGLGLTICQRLVKKYGGKIELDSSLGKGTVVKVSFPYDPA